VTAWTLHQAWPGSVMKMIPDAGHGAMEIGITRALVAATEQFKQALRFD
jgi:proline iminopeptidase